MLLQYSAIAFVTPPLAMAIFVVSQMFHIKVEEVTKGIMPFLFILILHLVIFLFFPEMLLWLPRLVFGSRADIPMIY